MPTTYHKVIGNLYFVTSMGLFLFGGVLALVVRAELAFPGLQFVSYETQNQLLTMHGAIMLLLFATPLFAREPPHYVRVTPRHLIGRQINVFGLPSEWWTVSP